MLDVCSVFLFFVQMTVNGPVLNVRVSTLKRAGNAQRMNLPSLKAIRWFLLPIINMDMMKQSIHRVSLLEVEN